MTVAALSLWELNSLVKQALRQTVGDCYWLRAEISELRVVKHCYLDFIQKRDSDDAIVAKAKAHIWASTYEQLATKFESETQQHLTMGMKVLVKVNVDFHEQYGYSLNVVDIDPTYTLGDIALRRKAIINQLQAEGLVNRNKSVPLPRLLQRIAVISSDTAAGYEDFCTQIRSSALAFYIKLFPAAMQGSDTAASVIAALNSIREEINSWDAVVIIRGGGAVADLSGFDSLELARCVALFPIPIITGIGHERDDTVVDIVSHTRVKTPSIAADFIIRHQENELHTVQSYGNFITRALMQQLHEEQLRVKTLTSRLPAVVKQQLHEEQLRVKALTSRLPAVVKQQLHEEQLRVKTLTSRLPAVVKQQLHEEQLRVKALTSRLPAVVKQQLHEEQLRAKVLTSRLPAVVKQQLHEEQLRAKVLTSRLPAVVKQQLHEEQLRAKVLTSRLPAVVKQQLHNEQLRAKVLASRLPAVVKQQLHEEQLRAKVLTSRLPAVVKQQLHEEQLRAKVLTSRLLAVVKQQLHNEQLRAKVLASRLPAVVKSYTERERLALQQKIGSTCMVANRLLQRQQDEQSLLQRHLRLYVHTLLQHEGNTLAMMKNKIESADPKRILKLGYSVTRLNGKAVSNVKQLKSGDNIETTFAIGSIKSIVQ